MILNSPFSRFPHNLYYGNSCMNSSYHQNSYFPKNFDDTYLTAFVNNNKSKYINYHSSPGNEKNLNSNNNFHKYNVSEPKFNNSPNSSSVNTSKQHKESNTHDTDDKLYNDYINVFGFKLYFDDILILLILFFLYQEDINDSYLYIILILLLIS